MSSPSVADVTIIDGTHLCLLPPSPLYEEAETTATVPSVPLLSVVPSFFVGGGRRRRRVAFSLLEEEASSGDGGASKDKDGDDGADNEVSSDNDFGGGGGGGGGGEAITKLTLRLPLHRHHHVERPFGAYTDKRGGRNDGGASRLIYADDGAAFLVHASPSSSSSSSRRRGGGNNDVGGAVRVSLSRPSSSALGDSDDFDVDDGAENEEDAPPQSILLRVDGAVGCFATDFCGVGGYEQLLVLPRVARPSPLDPVARKEEDEQLSSSSALERDKRLLHFLLERSVLTDGTTVLLPKRRPGDGSVIATMKTRSDRRERAAAPRRRIVLPPLAVTDLAAMVTTAMTEKEERATTGSPSSKPSKKRKRLSSIDETGPPNYGVATKEMEVGALTASATTTHEPMEMTTTTTTTSKTSTTSIWANKIEAALRDRLHKEIDVRRRSDAERLARRDLVRRGRVALRKLVVSSSPPSSSIDRSMVEAEEDGGKEKIDEEENDGGICAAPELVRLRYRTCPLPASSSSRSGSGLAVALDVEADLYIPSPRTVFEKQLDGRHDGRGGDSGPETRRPTLQDVHMSFSFDGGGGDGRGEVTVRTRSGIVPTLRCGDCVTLMAMVTVEGIVLAGRDVEGEREGEENARRPAALTLAIHALWMVGYTPRCGGRRRGDVLALLCLPLESIVLTTAMEDMQSIDFTDEANGGDSKGGVGQSRNGLAPPVPSATIECRNPRVLTFDAASAGGCGANHWEELAQSLNAAASARGGNRIDLHRDVEGGRVSLVVFGDNPDERAAMVELVLRYLPESLQIINEDEGERGTVRALRSSIKEEVGALERHRNLPLEQFRTTVLREMALLQCSTDGIASRIKRGWDGRS